MTANQIAMALVTNIYESLQLQNPDMPSAALVASSKVSAMAALNVVVNATPADKNWWQAVARETGNITTIHTGESMRIVNKLDVVKTESDPLDETVTRVFKTPLSIAAAEITAFQPKVVSEELNQPTILVVQDEKASGNHQTPINELPKEI